MKRQAISTLSLQKPVFNQVGELEPEKMAGHAGIPKETYESLISALYQIMEDAKVINFTKSLVKVYLDKYYAIEDFGGEEEFMEMGYVAIAVALENSNGGEQIDRLRLRSALVPFRDDSCVIQAHGRLLRALDYQTRFETVFTFFDHLILSLPNISSEVQESVSNILNFSQILYDLVSHSSRDIFIASLRILSSLQLGDSDAPSFLTHTQLFKNTEIDKVYRILLLALSPDQPES